MRFKPGDKVIFIEHDSQYVWTSIDPGHYLPFTLGAMYIVSQMNPSFGPCKPHWWLQGNFMSVPEHCIISGNCLSEIEKLVYGID